MTEESTSIYKKPALFDLELDNGGKEFESVINESSFRISLSPAKSLVNLFDECNFTQHGKSTWSRHIRNDTAGDIARFFNRYSDEYTPSTLFTSLNTMKAQHLFFGFLLFNGFGALRPQRYLDNRRGSEYGVNSNVILDIDDLSDDRFLNVHYHPFTKEIDSRYSSIIQHGEVSDVKNELSPGVFHVYVKNSTLWVKMYVAPDLYRDSVTPPHYPSLDSVRVKRMYDEGWGEAVSHLEKRINGKGKSGFFSQNFHPRWEIMPAIKSLNYLFEGHWTEESQAAFDLMRKAESLYTVGYSPGKPAKAYVTRGAHASKVSMIALGPGESKSLSLHQILRSEQNNPQTDFVIHPSLVDIVTMNKAEDYTDDDRLLSYQKTAVGLHLSTDIGYLNASDPGLGKSMMQLSSMRERAERFENYRGIITCEANVRAQWKEYAEEWFPEARVCVLSSSTSRQVDDLIEALSHLGPVIIVTSYSLAASVLTAKEKSDETHVRFNRLRNLSERAEFFEEYAEEDSTIGEILLNTRWNDICADEAVSIRNGASNQAKAMWLLRENSDVAVALTGTPVNKSPDDMGKLLEWVRKDKRLFHGHKLSVEYDSETLKGATDMFNDLTPLVFRKERDEVKGELENHQNIQSIPKMRTPETILLSPTPSETALAHAAEKELKRVYLELVSALDAVEADNGTSDDVKEAKEQLKNAHGQWLGGTQLARMATSDPESLLASDSVGASLLRGQGLVDEAMKDTPTKRKAFIERAKNHVEKGQSILVFTDFATVAKSLVKSLEDNGISAAVFTGGSNNAQKDRNRRAFQNGDIDVLVCTKAAERGLTLHRASAVYHYDIPWTIERLLQRMGRALRVGATNSEVEIYFMILEGTVEERVASQVLSQGTSASMILDASRGVDISKTGLGNTMSGLMSASKTLASRKGALEFGKALNLV